MTEVRRQTQTGGREAVEGWIPGDVALSVGMPLESAPEGFEWRLLSDVARLESGHTPSRKVPEYWDGGDIPWITVKEAAAHHGQTISETEEYITQSGEQNSSARLLPPNTVCLTRTGSIGFVVVMGRSMCTSQGLVNWVCGPDIDWRYLKYILLAESDSYYRYAWGSAHQTIYFPEVKAFHVLLPNIEEQRAIAGVLSALDDKIESNRRLREIVDGLVRAEFAMVSEGASVEQVDFESLACRVSRPAKPYELDSETPYVGLEHVPRGVLIIDDWGTAEGLESGKSFFDRGDVLFGKLRPYFKKVGVAPIAGVCSTDILVLRPRRSLSLLVAVAASEAFIAYSSAAASGTKMPRVSWDYLSKYKVVVPTPEAESRFADAVGPSIDRATKSVVESRSLRTLREVLLPELLSGRLRVRDAEKVIEEAV